MPLWPVSSSSSPAEPESTGGFLSETPEAVGPARDRRRNAGSGCSSPTWAPRSTVLPSRVIFPRWPASSATPSNGSYATRSSSPAPAAPTPVCTRGDRW